jgi:hypothetical protein
MSSRIYIKRLNKRNFLAILELIFFRLIFKSTEKLLNQSLNKKKYNMEKILLVTISSLLFLTCKNDELEFLQKKTIATEDFNTCLKSKSLPVLPKQDTYIEGELNGKYFSLSNHKQANVSCSLGSFRGNGYKEEYIRKSEATGNGFYVYPIGDSIEYQYYIQIEFPALQGDSLAYEKYFDQFQKGKTFNFLKGWKGFEESLIPSNIWMFLTFDGCNNIGYLDTRSIEQTGSYFRVSNVKEIKDAQGKVVDRQVTIEFDAQFGKEDLPVARIKNGKLVFWY